MKIDVFRLENGVEIIDAGIKTQGTAEAGRLISEICLGGLGQATLQAETGYPKCNQVVHVQSESPVVACLLSQYAGWSLSDKNNFNALGSGPARALGSNEPLFNELQYRDQSDSAIMLIESNVLPPLDLVDQIAQKCQVLPERLSIILTPVTSICGVVQVIARVLETALHKIHALEFPISGIKSGKGFAPICPVADNFIEGMGRTNDMILLAGEVELKLEAGEDELAELAKKLPSNVSPDYGKPFAEIFKDVKYDFYKIDPLLFSPAKIRLVSTRSGEVHEAGEINLSLLEQSLVQ